MNLCLIYFQQRSALNRCSYSVIIIINPECTVLTCSITAFRKLVYQQSIQQSQSHPAVLKKFARSQLFKKVCLFNVYHICYSSRPINASQQNVSYMWLLDKIPFSCLYAIDIHCMVRHKKHCVYFVLLHANS